MGIYACIYERRKVLIDKQAIGNKARPGSRMLYEVREGAVRVRPRPRPRPTPSGRGQSVGRLVVVNQSSVPA